MILIFAVAPWRSWRKRTEVKNVAVCCQESDSDALNLEDLAEMLGGDIPCAFPKPMKCPLIHEHINEIPTSIRKFDNLSACGCEWFGCGFENSSRRSLRYPKANESLTYFHENPSSTRKLGDLSAFLTISFLERISHVQSHPNVLQKNG